MKDIRKIINQIKDNAEAATGQRPTETQVYEAAREAVLFERHGMPLPTAPHRHVLNILHEDPEAVEGFLF